MMSRDIRSSTTYQQVEEYFENALGPGLGDVTTATDPALSPRGTAIAFTGTLHEALTGSPCTRICVVDATTGSMREASAGPHDWRPRWSPNSETLAYLSDSAETDIHQAHVLREGAGEHTALPPVNGTIEDIRWSADSTQLLALVAGRGADLAGAQGSAVVPQVDEGLPSWMPEVLPSFDDSCWRWLEVFEPGTTLRRQIPLAGRNIWEADWAGAQIVAIVSDTPDESAWYEARLEMVDPFTGTSRHLFRPKHQLGGLTGSPSGAHVAVVDALSSDRGVVAGTLVLIGTPTGECVRVDTDGVDISAIDWRDDDVLVWAGVRGLDSVIGEYVVSTGATTEIWHSSDAIGLRCAQISAAPRSATAFVRQSYSQPHTLSLVEEGLLRDVHAFKHDGTAFVTSVAGSAHPVHWSGRDGTPIDGLVTVPSGPGPFPLVVLLHGGPVWAFQERWTMGYPHTPVLCSQGYAVLHPNPRGSSGHGVGFIEQVYGDVGGEDIHDILRGVDELVASGIVDPKRLAVMGGSYGGYLSAWIITQDTRFRAAIPIAEISDWVSLHHTSNLGRWVPDVLRGSVRDPAGPYVQRSPVTYVDKVQTPVLHITGALDKCTPPSQAVEYHQALREQGVESECVIYPEEGHGIRRFPAVIDHLARILAFLDRHVRDEEPPSADKQSPDGADVSARGAQ